MIITTTTSYHTLYRCENVEARGHLAIKYDKIHQQSSSPLRLQWSGLDQTSWGWTGSYIRMLVGPAIYMVKLLVTQEIEVKAERCSACRNLILYKHGRPKLLLQGLVQKHLYYKPDLPFNCHGLVQKLPWTGPNRRASQGFRRLQSYESDHEIIHEDVGSDKTKPDIHLRDFLG